MLINRGTFLIKNRLEMKKNYTSIISRNCDRFTNVKYPESFFKNVCIKDSTVMITLIAKLFSYIKYIRTLVKLNLPNIVTIQILKEIEGKSEYNIYDSISSWQLRVEFKFSDFQLTELIKFVKKEPINFEKTLSIVYFIYNSVNELTIIG